MVAHRSLGSVPANTPAAEFFEKYIAKRVPIVITGLPDDAAFKCREWVRAR